MLDRPLLASSALLCAALLPAAAFAQLAIYEDWTGVSIRGDRWAAGSFLGADAGLELKRLPNATGQRLDLELRTQSPGTEAGRNAFNGLRLTRGDLPWSDAAAVNTLDVEFTLVADKLTKLCGPYDPKDPTDPSEVNVLLKLQTFNDGSSTGEGDQTGDHLALVVMNHKTEEPSVIDVKASVGRCADAACEDIAGAATNEPEGGFVLGTVTKGTMFKLRLTWDAAGDRFLARRGSTESAMTYAASIDATPAARPLALLGARAATGDCYEGNRTAQITARVGKVRTNAAAVIP